MEKLSAGMVFGYVTLTYAASVVKNGQHQGKWWMGECSCGASVGPYTKAHWVRKIRSCKDCKYKRRNSNRIVGTNNCSKAVYGNYKSSAKNRGLNFELEYDYWLNEIVKPCQYCGRTNTSYFNPQQAWETRFEYTGLDRIDSSLGYELGNIFPCCKVCNRAKSTMSLKDFVEWASAIANNVELIRSLDGLG